MTASFDERMAALRERFLDRAEGDAVELAAAERAGDREALRSIAHKLAGVAGTLGFPEISLMARAVEEAADRDLPSALERLLTAIGRLR